MEIEREEAQQKRARSLSVCLLQIWSHPALSLQQWGASHDEHVVQGQRSYHGDTHQSKEFVGCKFQPFRSVGLTSDALDSATHLSPLVARRVTLWGARGVRVGEAKNPGPEGMTVDSISLTRDNGAQFLMPDRG